MKRLVTVILLAAAFLVGVSVFALSTSAERHVSAQLAEGTPTLWVYLPLMRLDPTPTATPTPTPPPKCMVYVQNDTGGQLCYEVYNTGIGRKCFSGGRHLYGSFPRGSYKWHASARCGSADGTKTYPAGTYTHRFWCGAGASLQSGVDAAP